MSKLDKLIVELCPDGVVFKRLEDCCTLEKGNTPIQKAVAGKYPLVVTTAERKTCNMYQFDKPTVCIPLVSSRGHGVACLNQLYYQEGAFALGNILCGVTPKDSHELSAKFLHYYLNHQKDILIVPLMKGGANVSLTVSSLKKVKVPVPPLAVQDEIVNMLSNFENLILELTVELTARKKQYEYYEYKMLFNNDYKRVKLEEVCMVNQGLQIPISKRFKEPGANRYLYITVQFLKNNEDEQYYIENPDKNVICEKEDILVTRTGSTGVIITGEEGCFHNNFFKVNCKELVSKRYMYFLLKSSYMYQKMLAAASGGTVLDLPHKKFYNLEVPLPTLTEQKNTVYVLEKFEALCNDITTGLPAEIEARKKQYEYYRDKLLTFKELS